MRHCIPIFPHRPLLRPSRFPVCRFRCALGIPRFARGDDYRLCRIWARQARGQ